VGSSDISGRWSAVRYISGGQADAVGGITPGGLSDEITSCCHGVVDSRVGSCDRGACPGDVRVPGGYAIRHGPCLDAAGTARPPTSRCPPLDSRDCHRASAGGRAIVQLVAQLPDVDVRAERGLERRHASGSAGYGDGANADGSDHVRESTGGKGRSLTDGPEHPRAAPGAVRSYPSPAARGSRRVRSRAAPGEVRCVNLGDRYGLDLGDR